MASIDDIELQRDTLGRGRGQPSTIKNDSDEHEAAGYGDSSTKIWKLYATESERHDKALVESWKSNTDSMLIFTGLFSSIVASFLIETYKTLAPGSGSSPQSAPPSAVRVNIFLFLSLFFSVTSALVSTLIQQWAREYLQYSQPSAAPHKRGRVRAYLFAGLSRFQMRRLTYGVPVLLHLAVFLFFYAISEWLHSINVTVGLTARYCLIALLAIYMALSVLPLIVRNAPYQTALTTPLRACISLIKVSYILLLRFMRCSSTIYQAHKGTGLFKSVHIDRARALMREIQMRASKLDRSAMHWLLQELDEDDMDTFLSGLPGYLHSPLTDKKIAVEGLMEDGVPGRIREHITTCLRSVELSQEDSMSRASACINSLRLISETASDTAITRSSLETDDIQKVMEYIEPLCYDSPTALRASCIRGLIIREFLIPLVDLDDRKLQAKFPDYLIPLHKIISAWKSTETSQWSHITGVLAAPSHPPALPSDSGQAQQHMWADVYDGPLINLAALAYAVLSCADEEDVKFEMAWKTLDTLLKSLGLAQVRASPEARARFEEVLHMAHDEVGGYDGALTRIIPLLTTLDTVTRGLRLAEAFAYTPKVILPRKQIEVIFGPEQLRNTELLETFAAHLPGYVSASTFEASQTFMERLILEDKLWEQLHVSFLKCFDPKIPFPDKLRIFLAFFAIFDVAFDVLKESTIIDWLSTDLDLLFGHFGEFKMNVAPGESINKAFYFRSSVFDCQFCHVLLSQFAMRHSRGEPLMMELTGSLSRLVGFLGVGTQDDMDNLEPGNPKAARTGFDLIIKAGAILNVTLRDGPLSNFCILGRLAYDIMVSEVSYLTPDDFEKLLKTLKRMVHTPPAPFPNSYGPAWDRFDHLCALVRDHALSGGDSQTLGRLRPLLDMIEELERIRPLPYTRVEGMENVDNLSRLDASDDPETLQRGGPPIPGSSRQVGPSHIERGGPGATYFPPLAPTIPLAEMPQPQLRGWTSHSSSDPNWVMTDVPTGLGEPDLRQFNMPPIPEALYPGVEGGPSDPRFDPSFQASIHTAGIDPFAPRNWTSGASDLGPAEPYAPPTSFIATTQAGPDVHQMHPPGFTPAYMGRLSGPRRSSSLDSANIPVQAHTQPMITNFPPPPSDAVLAYPSPSSSSDMRRPGHVNQGRGGSVVWTGGLETTRDSNSRATDPGGE